MTVCYYLTPQQKNYWWGIDEFRLNMSYTVSSFLRLYFKWVKFPTVFHRFMLLQENSKVSHSA